MATIEARKLVRMRTMPWQGAEFFNKPAVPPIIHTAEHKWLEISLTIDDREMV
jgi:hypothetical protein